MIELLKKEPSLEFVIPVLKWLRNPESVSLRRLKANHEASKIALIAFANSYGEEGGYPLVPAVTASGGGDVHTCCAWVDRYFDDVSITRKEVEAELLEGEEAWGAAGGSGGDGYLNMHSHDNDIVQKPKHYELFDDTQVIEVIAGSMSTEAFHGYCLGNVLKYRLRAGNKDDVNQELAKANKYKELYEDFKHLCR